MGKEKDGNVCVMVQVSGSMYSMCSYLPPSPTEQQYDHGQAGSCSSNCCCHHVYWGQGRLQGSV